MFTIQTIGTGSTGNCYRISDGSTDLLLEAGLPAHTVNAAIGYRLSQIKALLISHEHGDHAKYYTQFQKCGIPVYASPGTALALGGGPIIPLPVFSLDRGNYKDSFQKIGTLSVLSFPVRHDATDPVGFYIFSHKTNDALLFLTDLGCPPNLFFKTVTDLMVECNYQDKYLADCNALFAARIRKNHFSLQNVLELMEHLDPQKLDQIHLIHRSVTHSDPDELLAAVRIRTGVPVYLADVDTSPRPPQTHRLARAVVGGPPPFCCANPRKHPSADG